ncbi:MAG: ribonuclease Z [Anaerolineales bacterium]|nr:MAG: ribonuclease Z [Anaerolineales bacterium]
MFEIVFLGTSASAPSVQRGLTSQVVLRGEHRFLIDAGEGTQRQILQSGLGFKRLDRILITHGHLDHILGLGGLISTFVRWEAMDKILIAAGQSALGRINDLLFGVVLKGKYPPVEITMQPLETGLIFDEGDFTVSAFPVFHRTPDCYGFVFQELSRRPFLPEKAEKLKIPPGPWRRELVNGRAVSLPDGRVIDPEMVLGEEQPGTKLVHVGDAGQTDNLLEVVRDADALVIEATYLEGEKELAEQFGHLTAKAAGELAAEAGVGTLILTHISRRYRGKQILEEAQEVFPNVFVAKDFDHFQIKRGEVLKL